MSNPEAGIEYNGCSSSFIDDKYIDLEPDHIKLVNSGTDMERARDPEADTVEDTWNEPKILKLIQKWK